MTTPAIPDLALWIQRIQDQTGNLFAEIGLGGDLAEAQDGIRAVPAVFVIPRSDDVAETSASLPRQRQSNLIDVYIAVNTYGSSRGAAIVDEIRALRNALRAALAGWRPADADDTIRYLNGKNHPPAANALWWIDTYQLNTFS